MDGDDALFAAVVDAIPEKMDDSNSAKHSSSASFAEAAPTWL